MDDTLISHSPENKNIFPLRLAAVRPTNFKLNVHSFFVDACKIFSIHIAFLFSGKLVLMIKTETTIKIKISTIMIIILLIKYWQLFSTLAEILFVLLGPPHKSLVFFSAKHFDFRLLFLLSATRWRHCHAG